MLLKVYDTDTDFVQIHEDTKVIAARAFSGYENGALREILLPEGLRSIGAAAFDGAGLTNVFLPATIEHMGSDVFRDCEALKTRRVRSFYAARTAGSATGWAPRRRKFSG